VLRDEGGLTQRLE
jgi:hypothetical protein